MRMILVRRSIHGSKRGVKGQDHVEVKRGKRWGFKCCCEKSWASTSDGVLVADMHRPDFTNIHVSGIFLSGILY